MKRFAALLLAGLLSCTTAVSAFAVTTNGDEWAIPSLEFAYEEGLFTETELQKAKLPMSRLEFCKVVMRFLHIVTGESYAAAQESPFADCDDADVAAAYEAGIIGGVEPGIFAPDRTITREQMAIMLARMLKQCEISLPAAETAPFSDISALYAASTQYISQLYDCKIISGYEDGTYGPFRQMTVQEAAISFVKAYRYAAAQKESQPMESQTQETKPQETTPAAKQESAVSQEDMQKVTIGGKTISLGMTMQEMEALCGAPDRIDETVYDLTRYIYQMENTAYFFVTFEKGQILEIFTPTTNFSYLGIDGNGTSADIKNLTYISATEHSAVISGEDAEARFPLDYEGNISGFWLQTVDFAQNKVPTSSLSQKQSDALEAEVSDIIRVKRAAAGLKPLLADSYLSVTAKAHSKDMVSNRFFSYNSKNGDSPFLRILNEGKTFSTASEVIAKQRGDVVNIYLDWIRNPSKISALKDPTMEEIGIGIATLSKELYVTIDLCGHGI